jgi:hypothetical protein
MKRFHWGNCKQEIEDLRIELTKLKASSSLAQANLNSQDLAYRELLAQNSKLLEDKELLAKKLCIAEINANESEAKCKIKDEEIERKEKEHSYLMELKELKGVEIDPFQVPLESALPGSPTNGLKSLKSKKK